MEESRERETYLTPLLDDLFTMYARLVKDKLIARINPKPRTCIPEGFNPHIHCFYHMDVSGHKIEDCWVLRHKIQDLIYEGVIIIDLLNQKYEINDHPKVYNANHLNPPRYSPTNHFIIENSESSNLRTKGSQNEHPPRP